MCFACVAGGADSSAAGVHIGTVRLPSPGHGDPPDTAGDSGTQVRPPASLSVLLSSSSFFGGGGGAELLQGASGQCHKFRTK